MIKKLNSNQTLKSRNKSLPAYTSSTMSIRSLNFSVVKARNREERIGERLEKEENQELRNDEQQKEIGVDIQWL